MDTCSRMSFSDFVSITWIYRGDLSHVDASALLGQSWVLPHCHSQPDLCIGIHRHIFVVRDSSDVGLLVAGLMGFHSVSLSTWGGSTQRLLATGRNFGDSNLFSITMSTNSSSPDLSNIEAGFGEPAFDSKDDTLVVTTPASGGSPKSNTLDLGIVSDLLKHQGQQAAYTFEEKGKWRDDTPKLPYQLKHKRNTFKPAGSWIRFQLWFNTYRKFWVFIVSLELAGMIAAGAGKFPYAHSNTGGIVIGNILAGVVVRNELFGRLLYLLVNALFAKWTPLWWRLCCSSVLQHLGGIHSGCSVSAIGWLIYNLVELFRNRSAVAPAVLAMGATVLVTVAFTAVAATPWIRNTHHKYVSHVRITILSLNLFSVFSNAITAHDSLSVALPWTYTRKVPVHIEIPSQKVAIIRFERGMQQGLLGRISRTAIWEYHTFGIIRYYDQRMQNQSINLFSPYSASPYSNYHYMICGVQGDFTRQLVVDRPTHLWTREVKFAGVGNTSTLYKRGIRICTGTGIGAALSTCLQSDQWFLIWIGSDANATLGPTIMGLIERGVGHRAIVWDTKKFGRPNTMELLAETFSLWKAEVDKVVFITSNWQGNQEMMQGCKMRGIPAFGE
ncbi:hypothetical protein AG1IA_07102 [Rhizoctonia solani AG-1 IA]|uniref:Uncharacterized protein n=1 Tax=Thanatephorus cucumeris (strain AG1-IA) TaxID=983506 RepID=L8WQ21_THACA|nr:hypothetical protein AG1IA_07102 [Rhizoctonia solani AG-1 IA]